MELLNMEQRLQQEENRTTQVTTSPQLPANLSTQQSDSVDELLSRLQQEAARRNKYRRLFLLIFLPYFCLYLVHAFNWFVRGIHPPWFFSGLMASFITFSMWALEAWMFKENTARMVAQLDDIRAVGPLAEILGVKQGQFQYEEQTVELAKLALIRLLPRLQASDAHLLNAEQRKRLCLGLNDKRSSLVLVILKAFEQVGDAEALPYVRKLADGKGRARKEKRVQEAAQTCLPFLIQRAEQTLARQTLLRAAGTSEVTEGELLRPASGVSSTYSSQLLRTEWPSERG